MMSKHPLIKCAYPNGWMSMQMHSTNNIEKENCVIKTHIHHVALPYTIVHCCHLTKCEMDL